VGNRDRKENEHAFLVFFVAFKLGEVVFTNNKGNIRGCPFQEVQS